MTNISITKKEFNALNSLISSKYMDWSSEDEHSDYEIEEYNASMNISKKMLRALNKQGTWYLYQLIDRDGAITRDNISPEYLVNF